MPWPLPSKSSRARSIRSAPFRSPAASSMPGCASETNSRDPVLTRRLASRPTTQVSIVPSVTSTSAPSRRRSTEKAAPTAFARISPVSTTKERFLLSATRNHASPPPKLTKQRSAAMATEMRLLVFNVASNPPAKGTRRIRQVRCRQPGPPAPSFRLPCTHVRKNIACGGAPTPFARESLQRLARGEIRPARRNRRAARPLRTRSIRRGFGEARRVPAWVRGRRLPAECR